jgi:hypothetical protein
MCPACITSAALAVAGATSAGGFVALVAKTFRSRNAETRVDPTINPTEITGRDSSPKSRGLTL